MSGVRIGDGPVVPAMFDACDEIIFVQVVTCDTGEALVASAVPGAMIWLSLPGHEDREAVIVKVDRGLWEITCALPSGTCPWCGTPLNEAGLHLNAVIGAACEHVHPRPPQDGDDE